MTRTSVQMNIRRKYDIQKYEALEAVIISAVKSRYWVQEYPEARQYLFETTFDRFVSLINRI